MLHSWTELCSGPGGAINSATQMHTRIFVPHITIPMGLIGKEKKVLKALNHHGDRCFLGKPLCCCEWALSLLNTETVVDMRLFHHSSMWGCVALVARLFLVSTRHYTELRGGGRGKGWGWIQENVLFCWKQYRFLLLMTNVTPVSASAVSGWYSWSTVTRKGVLCSHPTHFLEKLETFDQFFSYVTPQVLSALARPGSCSSPLSWRTFQSSSFALWVKSKDGSLRNEELGARIHKTILQGSIFTRQTHVLIGNALVIVCCSWLDWSEIRWIVASWSFLQTEFSVGWIPHS